MTLALVFFQVHSNGDVQVVTGGWTLLSAVIIGLTCEVEQVRDRHG